MFKEIKAQFKEIEITAKILRYFGVILGLLLAISWFWHRDMLIVIAGMSIIWTALFFPLLFSLPYKIILCISLVIGFFISRIALIFIYFIVVSFIGLLLRAFKKDIMEIKIDKGLKSYFKSSVLDSEHEKMF